MNINYIKESKGFTLIELLVVVLMIGILASLAITNYTRAVSKSQIAEGITAAKSLKDAQELYYLSHGKYAASLDELEVKIPSQLKYFYLELGQMANGRFAFNNTAKNYYIVASGDYRSDGGVRGILYCCANSEEAKAVCASVGEKINNPSCASSYRL